LAEATQKQAKREEAVVEWLDTICMSVGSWCLKGPVGKPQEEGMMRIAISFPLVWNQGLIDQ
jgi:hypothetical protein